MSRNQKATVLTSAFYVISFLTLIWGAMLQPETRISGDIGKRPIEIPAWQQDYPEYKGKIQNAKISQGWGGGRLLLWLLVSLPCAIVGTALACERMAELEKERKLYKIQLQKEEEEAKLEASYQLSLNRAMKQKAGEARLALHEDRLLANLDEIREENGWVAPTPPPPPQIPAAPPILRDNPPIAGLKPPAQFEDEIAAARQKALDRLNEDGAIGGTGGSGDTPKPDAPDGDADRKKFYQNRGAKLSGNLAALRLSILSAAPTGAGKSTTMDRWLSDYQQLFPEGEAYVIAQKNDSFMGLAEKGRVKKFNAFSPEIALQFLDIVYAEMHRRLDQPENERGDFLKKPVRLILDDWHATYSVLKNIPALWQVVKTKLVQIITLGREANVCLYIATQSYNLVTLGLVEDSGIRANLAITCQGLVKSVLDENGELTEQGDYSVLRLLIQNQYIVPGKEDRERLTAELEELIGLSIKYQVPAVFSAIGTPTLGLMPFYEKGQSTISNNVWRDSNVAVIDSNSDEDSEDIPEISDAEARRWAMEFDLNHSSNHSSITPEEAPNDSQNNDMARVSESDTSSDEVIDTESDEAIGNKNWATDSWFKWLPSKEDVVKLLEETDANFYSLAYIVRTKLKKTDAEYNRKAKRAIVQLMLDLDRDDLIQKYQINPKDYSL